MTKTSRLYLARTFSLGLLVLVLTACPDDEGGTGSDLDAGPDAGDDVAEDLAPDTSEDAGDASDTGDGGCTLGETTCACNAGACSDPSDECTGGVCLPRTDCAGELGCACNDDRTCDDGYTCSDDLCRIGNGVALRLTGGDARACDVVLLSQGRQVQDVVFPAGTRGRMRTRNERTAIAVIRTADAALEGIVGTVVFEGADDVALSEIESLTSSCYGRLGAADEAATVAAE